MERSKFDRQHPVIGSLLKDVDRTQEEKDLKSVSKTPNPEDTELEQKWQILVGFRNLNDQLQNLPSISLKVLEGVMIMKRIRKKIIRLLQQHHHLIPPFFCHKIGLRRDKIKT